MIRKSVLDRYTQLQLYAFLNHYLRDSQQTSHAHAAACSAINTLCTIRQWDGPARDSIFDDALALAGRIDSGYCLKDTQKKER